MKLSNLDCSQFERIKWCSNDECEYRHLSRTEKSLRETPLSSILKQSPSFINILNEPQLIITAGPERSGSTWLYNAIRLLFLHSNQCINSYWVHTVNKNKILSRLSCVNDDINDEKSHMNKNKMKDIQPIEHLLIKTHEYPFTKNEKKLSDFMQLKPKIIISHRDLRSVVLSYRRVGWSSFLPYNYVSDHLKWTSIATLDLGFEDFMKDQINALKVIAKHIGILTDNIKQNKQCESWVNYVCMDLNGLKAPTNKVGPDNISKLWPSHIGNPNSKVNVKRLDKKTKQQIFQKYPQFMKLYNYVYS